MSLCWEKKSVESFPKYRATELVEMCGNAYDELAGYLRIASSLAAFAVALRSATLCVLLYSFGCAPSCLWLKSEYSMHRLCEPICTIPVSLL